MKTIIITSNDADQRLDKFLKKLLPNASLWLIYKLNRKGNIKINKKKKANDYVLTLWDEVKLFVSDEDYQEFSQKIITRLETQSGKLHKKDIIYEDDHILVINKNAWVIVHPGDFKTTDLSLIEQVQDYVWNSGWGHTFSPSLVHRIDKETSGIILIAKQKQLLVQLVSDFKTHKNIKKTYRVFVIWKLSRESGTIKKKLLRIEWAKNQNKVQVSEKWQSAITHFQKISEYTFSNANGNIIISELSVEIETGRMHQIRVHLAELWNPILWDSKYWNKNLNWFFKKHYWITRQMLHASDMEVYNNTTKKKMKFFAPLKSDMKNLIAKWNKN